MVSSEPRRRRLSVDDRREELFRACLRLIGTRPWDEVSMAEVAATAGVSKPLVYHYFSTKSDLYLAAVQFAADELSEATRPDPSLPIGPRLLKALRAHLDWIDDHDVAYRAILQGGISSDKQVQAIVDHARSDVVERLAEAFEYGDPTPAQRTAMRGWVGYLEAACLDWLAARDLSKSQLTRLLAASVNIALGAADVIPAAAERDAPSSRTSRRRSNGPKDSSDGSSRATSERTDGDHRPRTGGDTVSDSAMGSIAGRQRGQGSRSRQRA